MIQAGETHVMVDLETLGLANNAVVLSIGAVIISSNVDAKQSFYVEINPSSYPGNIEADTVKFWFNQASKGNPPPIGSCSFITAIVTFDRWLKTLPGEIIIWANGTDFDIPKLCYMYSKASMEVFWKYSNVRDYRTVKKLFDTSTDTYKASHNALEDAIAQAEKLKKILPGKF